MPNTINPYAENLKRYRVKNGLSQEDMAVKLGLKNQQAYQYYEAGNLNVRKAKRFSIILGHDLTQINDTGAAITVILKYIAKWKAKEERLSQKTALMKIMEEIEIEQMVNTPSKSLQ